MQELSLEKTNGNGRKYYPVMDCIRLCCALMVVMIHTVEIHEGHPIAQTILSGICGQAVPFFFVASGFFFKIGGGVLRVNQLVDIRLTM